MGNAVSFTGRASATLMLIWDWVSTFSFSTEEIYFSQDKEIKKK